MSDFILSQTRVMTALDIWLLMCMIFVALATFEYAILLKIKFGIENGKNGDKEIDMKKRDEQCRKMDHYALIMFLVAYGITVFTYIYAVSSYS